MIPPQVLDKLRDPFNVMRMLWPDMVLYNKQREIILSIKENLMTLVPAGNQLGKDFIAGRLCVCAFLFPNVFLREGGNWIQSQECRIVTTSVKDDHLRVLWGEIGRAVQQSRIPLEVDKGGPLILNHRDIRKRMHGQVDQISYLRGMVSEKGEGMAGHHAAHTLFVGDEASGLDNEVFVQQEKWAKRALLIGNCRPTANKFKEWVEMGDLAA